MTEIIPTDDPNCIEVPLRVRYVECDPMNVAHHSAYPPWLEIARTHLLRHRGISYRDLERRGVFFAVVRLSVSYRRPAFYDDELVIRARMSSASRVKVDHDYEVKRGHELLATATTTLACLDREGKVQAIPSGLPGLSD